MILRAILPGAILAALLLLVPVFAYVSDNIFVLTIASRALLLASAATSLNLIMGYGGLINLGHAVFIGIGAYIVGIGSHHAFNDDAVWLTNGFFQLALVISVSALLGLAIGAMSLRTRGVYFLMITLAFGQMIYLAAVGAYSYGGDDGMTVFLKTDFSGFRLSGYYTNYWLAAGLLALSLFAVYRLSRSRFGLVLRAAKTNEQRARALGYEPFQVRLVAFVIAGVIAGIAGFLMANQTGFVSPAMMHWTRSGELIVMVVLGGLGTIFGPLLGAIAFLALEEVLSGFTEYWAIPLGLILIAVARYMPSGLSIILGKSGKDG
ncbi:MAG: branched-chain amino acid ABC transporter permease [Rhizobiaceae bacterium]